MRDAGRALVLLLVLNLATSGIAAADDWPPNYIIHENSESPDGRYAVLVQSQDAALAEADNESAVYLADTKAHATLGEIGKVDYFEHQNHRGLEVFWATGFQLLRSRERRTLWCRCDLDPGNKRFQFRSNRDRRTDPKITRRRDEETSAQF